MSHSHKQIAGMYKNSSDLGLNSRQVITRLIGTLILNLEHAKNAHAEGKLEVMANYNIKSLKIIAFIRVSLQNEYIDTSEPHVLQLADYLRRLYQDIYIRLANVLLNKQPQAEFDHFLILLREQYQAWLGKVTKTGDLASSDPASSAEGMIAPLSDPARQSGGMTVDKNAAQDFYA